MRELLKVGSAFAVLLAFYFGCVLLVDHLEERPAYSTQIQNTKSLMRALQDYRRARGSYPVFPVPDSPMIELKELLAKNQASLRPFVVLSEADKDARYVSYTGKNYGLLLRFNRADNGQPVTCRVEVEARNTGWWGQPPKCPF